MNNIPIPSTSEGLLYLGLPIGIDDYISEYFNAKMKKVEKAIYSLRGLGCKPNCLSPKTIAFIYKQYCQSIFKFGIETLTVSKPQLNRLNVRQNVLIKNILNVKHRTRYKVLINVLGIDQIDHIYYKHKIFFYKQVIKNNITNKITKLLLDHYQDKKPLKNSFFSQLSNLKSEHNISIEPGGLNYHDCILAINEAF